MALSLDAVASADTGATEGSSTLSWSHTCTGSNLYLFVGFSLRAAGPDATLVSTLTYNSVSMTRLGAATNGSTRAELWGLVAPATGTNTVLATGDASFTAGIGGSVSYTGADQTGSASSSTIRGGTATTATGTSSTPSVTVSSATGDFVQDVIGVSSLVTISSVGSGQTQDWNRSDAGANVRRGAGSHENGAASVVMDWTLSGSGAWASVGASLIPASGGGGFTAKARRTMGQFGRIGERQMQAWAKRASGLLVPERRIWALGAAV